MNVWKLRLSMIATLAVIISLSTLVFAVLLMVFTSFSFITLGVLVVGFNVFQWLISPYLVDGLYRTREAKESENPKLHEIVSRLSQKSGIKEPKLMIAQIPIPNAFAYGSPLTGNRVAVTEGMMKTLNDGEIEAVLGHELGHLKYKDVQTMMFVSMLPAIFTYLGYSFMLSSGYGKQRDGNGGVLLGIAFMAFSWILNMFILYLSRIREYYADHHSTLVVDNGAQKLSTGLAKIVNETKNLGRQKKQSQNKNQHAFKALFIADPDRAETDHMLISTLNSSGDERLVQNILSQKLTTTDRLIEIFSTHPNIVKRLRTLQEQ